MSQTGKQDMGHESEHWEAMCGACGWSGSSKDCFGDSRARDVGGYDDLQCPSCLSHSIDEAAALPALP